MRANAYREGYLFKKFYGPSLSGLQSVAGKAISLYEAFDDQGTGMNSQSKIDGNMGGPIACCNIRPLKYLQDATQPFSYIRDDRRRLNEEVYVSKLL